MKDLNGIVAKRGDQVILKSSRHSMSGMEGQLFDVIGINNNGQLRVVPERNPRAMPYNIFSDDKFVVATREEKLKFTKEKLENLKVDIAVLEEEINFLEKYESTEAFVAEKIGKLLAADTDAARTEILKALKDTNLI